MTVLEYLKSFLGINKKSDTGLQVELPTIKTKTPAILNISPQINTPQAEMLVMDVKEASLKAERSKFLNQYYTIDEAKEFANNPAVIAMKEFCDEQLKIWLHSDGGNVNFGTKPGTLLNIGSQSLDLNVNIGDVGSITRGFLYIDPDEMGYRYKKFDRSCVYAYGKDIVPLSVEIHDNTLVTAAGYNEVTGKDWNVFNGYPLSQYKKENIYTSASKLQTAVDELRVNAEKNHDFYSLKVISEFMRTFEPFMDAVLDMRNKYKNIEATKDVGLGGR